MTAKLDRLYRLRVLGLPVLASLAPLLALGPASGCFWVTTKSEGETLRKDVTVLRGRVDTKEKDLGEQIMQLQTVLANANRAGANLGADLDSLRNDIRTANGLVTAVNNSVNELKQSFDTYRKATDARLDALEQRVVQIESGKPTAVSSPEELWKLGTAAYQAQRYNEAIDIFKRLSQTYPTHERASDAVYFRGQSYTNLKDWDHAIGVYQQLYEKYPDSPLADDGLYFAAIAAQQLKNCTEARAYLGVVKQKYPKSNVTKQADDLEKTLKKDLKNKAKCNA
ncbi:MAG: tetratricopeptide repeat protein [Deltaproteobacteria bacterium]|nr:MAG: tetratricopeptide repeat protein [Deltaproteobacteria bacterium]